MVIWLQARLIQIKSGIEKGLTEGQLVELINNNVAAEDEGELLKLLFGKQHGILGGHV